MRLVAAIVVSALLAGCPSGSIRPVDRTYREPLELPSESSARIRVLPRTAGEVRVACYEAGGRPHAHGCAWLDGDEYRIAFRRPESWNDWKPICVLGHEVLHAIGGRHE